MSGPRIGLPHMNGNNRRPGNGSIAPRLPINEGPVHAQHDDLIKYIYESWTKVEMDKGSNSVMYYQDETAHHLKDFKAFDLEGFWGARLHQHMRQQHS
nr:unnamed protein product [Callosobruchus analis]